MPITHCFLLSQPPCRPPLLLWLPDLRGKSPPHPLNATRPLMVKWLPEDLEERKRRCSSLMAMSRTVSACGMYMSVYVCVCINVGERDCTAYMCVSARLVVCHSAREQPLFTYTRLSRGGTVCECVCVCVCVSVCVYVCERGGRGVSSLWVSAVNP